MQMEVWAVSLIFVSLGPWCVTCGTTVNILLESYSIYQGLLYNGQHCDPFWFTGLDNCDIDLQICIEPNQISTPSISSCASGPFMQLGTVTNNQDSINFQLGPTGGIYGSWTNPRGFHFSYNWQGFSVKLIARDADRGGSYQLIDQFYSHIVPMGASLSGSATYSHIRPGSAGATTLNLAWTVVTVSNTSIPTPPSIANTTYTSSHNITHPSPNTTYVSPNSSTPIITSIAPVTTPTCCNGVVDLNQHKCHCNTHWTGLYCCVPICQNNGTVNGTGCNCVSGYSGPFCDTGALLRSCADIYIHGLGAVNGNYTINTVNGPKSVLCDMASSAPTLSSHTGGWTVIQNRVLNESGSFNRNWTDYRTGFFNSDGAYWLGNDIINDMTTKSRQSLRIDLWDYDGIQRSVVYSKFSIGSLSQNYSLSITPANFTTAGDGFAGMNTFQFVTSDHGDTKPKQLASRYEAGWWLSSSIPNSCLNSPEHNLLKCTSKCYVVSPYIRWNNGFLPGLSLAVRVQMKIRPASFSS